MNNKLGRTISNLLNPNVLLGSKENLKKFSFQTDDDYNSKSFDIDWNVNEVKKQVATYVDQGKLSPDLADILVRNGTCAPIEFDLLDYKEDIEVDTYNLAKLVLRIVSFYNSLGGYIVFGVAETNPETKFDVVGFEHSKLNIETIKALIKEFTGVRIQIASTSISTKKEDGKFVDIVFLHIPKRPKTERPLQFLKNGPGDNKNKLLFQKEEVYCRRGDECSQAKGNYIFELAGERINPYLDQVENSAPTLFRLNRLDHNLPDRNFICAKFIGRDSIVDSLWSWLADDLSHIRVIAGEGGLGKSSIAYEFSERVSETPNVPFEQIVWLTAKEKQFNAFDDLYVNSPERHYSTYIELLETICSHLPFTTEELDGATETELKRMVKKGLSDTPTLLIIDDVDSLSVEEQKKVLEIGLIIGGSNSRILVTTRNNQSYSNDTVLKISGFSAGEEFNEYMRTLQDRLNFNILNASDINKIYAVTNGSPLFTESLVRLLRWNTLSEAISRWKGGSGSSVRAAALKHEIEDLSTEAKRVLLTIAIMVEASIVELTEVLSYSSESIESSLTELESLFLIAAPTLASIPRFRVPENTRRLVIDANMSLVTDKTRLEKEITTFKHKNNQKPTNDYRVAHAISQAGALLRSGDIDNALATIADARKRTQDHFDLLSFEATLLLKTNPPQIDKSRKIAREAYLKGCSKSEVFECWFEAEWLAKNYVGALEASDAALKIKVSGNHDWLIRKSAALAAKANDQSKLDSYDKAIKTMFDASMTIRSAISIGNRDDVVEWKNQQNKFHDQIWLWPITEPGFIKTTTQLDILENMRKYGDERVTNKKRVLSTMAGLCTFIEKKQIKLSVSQQNLYSTLVTKADSLLKDGNGSYPDIKNTWETIQNAIAIAIEKYE